MSLSEFLLAPWSTTFLTDLDTSKNDSNVAAHGGDGTFLSSLAALSILTITSHHHAHNSHASLILHHSRPAARLVPAPIRHHLRNREHGTRITVQELFGNMPVRVKHRIIKHDENLHEKEWRILKKQVVGRLLRWGMPIIFSLKSTENNKKLSIRGKDNLLSSNAETVQPSESFDISSIRSILSQAEYIEPSSWDEWIKTSVQASSIVIHGAISLQPAPSKHIQFISIGLKYLNSETNHILLDNINETFASSDFGMLEDISNFDSLPQTRDGENKRRKENEFRSKQLRASGKGVDRWPMFYIRIDLEDRLSRHWKSKSEPLESDSTLQSIINALNVMIKGFLNDYNFRPRIKRAKTSRVTFDKSPFEGPSRSKSQQILSQKGDIANSMIENPTSSTVNVNDNIGIGSTPASKLKFKKRNEKLERRISADILNSNITLPDFPRRSSQNEEIFSSWSRIKSGRLGTYEEFFSHKKKSEQKLQNLATKDVNDETLSGGSVSSGQGLVKTPGENASPESTIPDAVPMIAQEPLPTSIRASNDIEHVDTINSEQTHTNPEKIEDEIEETAEWLNPISRATVTVSARTGLVIRQPSRTASLDFTDSKALHQPNRKLFKTNSRLARHTSNPFITPKRDTWASKFFQTWRNPVFCPTEEAVPRISLEGPKVDASHVLQGRSLRCSEVDIQRAFTESSSLFSARISKNALMAAKVISQVDKKFILACMSLKPQFESAEKGLSHPQEILVLIDQHAADERIRVETLLATLCQRPRSQSNTDLSHHSDIESIMLPTPISFPIRAQERDLLIKQASYFAKWGIHYSLSEPQRGPKSARSSGCNVLVKELPEVIAERCRSDHKVLVDLIRGEAWKREGLEPKTTLASPQPLVAGSIETATVHDKQFSRSDEHDGWLTRIGDCPQGILDMVNSRSCRSAIMFNDELTTEECQTLVRSLAGCAFPFQCAHGRPSMIPLVQLGSNSSCFFQSGRETLGPHPGLVGGETEKDFCQAWRAWKAGMRKQGQT